MQPLQCGLEPQIPKHPRTTRTRRTKHCKTPSRNQSHTKRNGPHPPGTRGTFHRRPKPLHTEKHKVSCSGFLPKKTCDMNAAITMRFAALRAHSCSHDLVTTPLPKVTISLGQHFPQSPLPKVTAFPSSPLPFVSTSLGHHFHKSPHHPAWMYCFVT